MSDHDFVVGEHAFVLDERTDRALPVIITEALTRETYPKCMFDGAYKVELDKTDAVKGAEAYNGYAKSQEFKLHTDGIYRGLDVFDSAVAAYDALIARLERYEDELKRALKQIPDRISQARKRMNIAGKTAGAKYDNGTVVYVFGSYICNPETKIVKAEIEKYDRSGFTTKPYLVVDKKYPLHQHCNWLDDSQFFLTRADAVKALKATIRARYKKELEEIGY